MLPTEFVMMGWSLNRSLSFFIETFLKSTKCSMDKNQKAYLKEKFGDRVNFDETVLLIM